MTGSVDFLAARNATVEQELERRGIDRREFFKLCGALASLMALPASAAEQLAAAVAKARRPSVIWLSFQECTGCTESLTRSHSPSLESLIFDLISLDYHHTLQAASGDAAEAAREAAMKENAGKYLLVVDGSIPLGNPGYSTIAGVSATSRCSRKWWPGRGGGDRRGHLRRLRRPAGGPAQSHRRRGHSRP